MLTHTDRDIHIRTTLLYIHTYPYTHSLIHSHTSTFTHILTLIHILMHIHTHLLTFTHHTQRFKYIYSHTDTCTLSHIHIHTCVCLHTHSHTHTTTHTCLYTPTPTHLACWHNLSHSHSFTDTFALKNSHTHLNSCTYTHIHTNLHTCKHTCTNTFTHAHTGSYTFTHLNSHRHTHTNTPLTHTDTHTLTNTHTQRQIDPFYSLYLHFSTVFLRHGLSCSPLAGLWVSRYISPLYLPSLHRSPGNTDVFLSFCMVLGIQFRSSGLPGEYLISRPYNHVFICVNTVNRDWLQNILLASLVMYFPLRSLSLSFLKKAFEIPSLTTLWISLLVGRGEFPGRHISSNVMCLLFIFVFRDSVRSSLLTLNSLGNWRMTSNFCSFCLHLPNAGMVCAFAPGL